MSLPADPPVPSPTADTARRRAFLTLAAAGVGGVAAAVAVQPPRAHAAGTADDTLSNLADYPAARKNLGVARMVTPEQYGAIGDGTTDDAAAIQAAIDALAAADGGAIWFTAPSYLIGSTITLKSGVTLTTGTHHRSILVDTGTTILKAAPGLTGWMFDTVGTSGTLGIALVGLNIKGPGPGLSTAVGGIRLRSTLNARLQWLSINDFSAPCISSDQLCTSLAIEDCVIQTDSSGRTLTAPCGSLDLGGTDHYIRSIQCNGGPSNTSGADGKTHVTYPGNFYRTGAHIHCITSWIYDLSGEFGDVGVHLDSTANNNRFIGTRADVNAGHGFYLNGAKDNQFVGCYAVGNSFAALDTYDGAIMVNGAKRNRWSNFLCHPYGGIWTRYGWNDATTGNRPTELNLIDGLTGPVAGVTRDLHRTADPIRYAIRPNGAGPSSHRPPSRHLAGGTWYDTTLGKPTFSDGSAWRDAAGAVVGNLVSPDQATGRDALKWGAVGTACTVVGMYTLQGTATVQAQFQDVPKLVVATSTSGAVATGKFQAQGTTTFPVTAGTAHTFGCRTLAATVPADVAIGANWFGAGGAYLSTSYAGAATNSTSTLTTATGSLTPPAGALTAQLLVVFARTGMAAGESHYLSFGFAVIGASTEYVEP